MSTRVHELSQQAWRQGVFWTVTIISVCVLVSVAISCVLLDVISEGINGPGLVTAIVMPIILGGPIMFYMQLRHQQLKLANLKLDILASTDWLTDTLNRRAFTKGASALLAEGSDHRGALLVIDVDRFKSVNDQFGHEAGDEALQLLARTILASVRTGDLVGRIGGEEFGVFLPGADYDIARVASERIRLAVAALRFAPGGVDHALSVSIGGVTAANGSRFSDLFRIADQQLYDAKLSGRNRVELVRLSGAMCTPANGNAPGRIDKTASIGL